MSDLLLLCFEFSKVGLFAIGGGLATVPFLMQMSENYPHWFSQQQLVDLIAVSESTPGAIGVNMSTYVGFLTGGVVSGILATFALVLPSIIIILVIAKFMQKFADNTMLQSALSGIRPAVTGLIASAGYTVFRLSVMKDNSINIIALTIFLLLFGMTLVKKIKLHPIGCIVLGAILGIIFKL